MIRFKHNNGEMEEAPINGEWILYSDHLAELRDRGIRMFPDIRKDTILFLDFDGVLCTTRASMAVEEKGLTSCLDPLALRFLDTLCREYPNLGIVISSTWRLGTRPRVFSEIFGAALCPFLKEAILHEDHKTKYMDHCTRGDEIKEWLSRHPEVINYVILDDDNDMLEEQENHFVRTSFTEGMSAANMGKVRRIVSGEFLEENSRE